MNSCWTPARSRLPSARVSPKLAKSVRSSGLAICRTSVLCSAPSAPRLTSLTIQATSSLPQRENRPKHAASRFRTPNLETVPFIVTSLDGVRGRTVYQDIYCARGQAENHIKAWKTHLAADRTSCCRATANQMRLFLHIGAYWLLWSLRAAMPRRSAWRVAEFDTLRLRLIKLAARVEVLKRKLRLYLPRSTPNQPIFACALTRLSRMLT